MDIARSKAAIGCEFRFPLDVELSATPNLNNVHNSALFFYLRNVSTDSVFALSIIQILIEDRHNAHRDRYNKDKLICNLKVEDVVKVHVQVDSVASKGIVSKLSYKSKGSFVITAELGNNSFEVQSYNDPTLSKHKYKNTELYLLHPILFPSHLLDTIDQRYLNSIDAPIIYPLKKSMKIELYTEKWLCMPNMSTPTYSTIVNLLSSELDNLAFLPHPDTQFPSTSDLHAETQTSHSVYGEEDTSSVQHLHTRSIHADIPTSLSLIPPLVCIHDALSLSKNKLCFVQYTLEGSMIRRW